MEWMFLYLFLVKGTCTINKYFFWIFLTKKKKKKDKEGTSLIGVNATKKGDTATKIMKTVKIIPELSRDPNNFQAWIHVAR